MKKRKFISLFLILCLIFSINIKVSAAETDSNSLEKAILHAKNIVDIPNDYNNFTHYLSENNNYSNGTSLWRLSWSTTGDNHKEISISIDEDGNLYDFNKYENSDSVNGLANISKAKGEETAKEFLEKVFQSNIDKMKKVNEISNDYTSDSFSYRFQQFSNDIPISFSLVTVGVNKYTGEVSSFYRENPPITTIEYPSSNNIINFDSAKNSYINNIGISLKYYSNYDYNKKALNIFPAYSINSTSKAIDAKSGQPIELYNENKFYDNLKADGSSMESANDSNDLTPEENDAINNVSNLITKENAEKIIKDNVDSITSNEKITDSSLRKNSINNNYIWEIMFNNAYGNVDAKSGELLSFYSYSNDQNENKNVSESDAKNIAENFLKKVALDKFNQTKYSESSAISLNDNNDFYSFKYTRQVNGIDFVNNSLSIQVNKRNGKITEYNNTWYDNASFPDINNIISKGSAFDKINYWGKFALEYSLISEGKAALVYNFTNLDGSCLINPIDGTRLGYNGKPYNDNNIIPKYSDIKGHASENIINALLDNGYYIKGNQFNPDNNITQINFLKYLYSPVQNYYNDDELYNMAINNGVLEKDEKSPESPISTQDAAKFIVRYLKYDKIAEHSEIFNNPFKDTISEEYKGYASICFGLGIIKGDDNGNFNGTKNITNADASQIIYNLLLINKQ